MKIRLFVVCSLALFYASLYAEAPPKYSLIRITIPDQATLKRVFDAGIDYEGVTGTIGGQMEFVASEFDRSMLTRAGIFYSVVIRDIEAETRKRLHPVVAGAQGFGTGSMSGYYTLAEVISQLDSMHAKYPDIVSAKYSIGKSLEGRDLWMIRIGQHSGQDDTTRPQVLFTALHHAREPDGLMSVLYYMWWLVEHYTGDARAAYLVNNREQYFLPVVNPDGYVFNQQMMPGGGGMWRKNRRDNGDGTNGVDLDRNYGPLSMWDAPNNNGSVITGNGDTYRGTAPFSEPEVAAIDTFIRAHRIAACLNYHAYGKCLIYPYGALGHETPDSITFREFAFDMTNDNRYQFGTDWETVFYATRGTCDDYLYGDISKPRTFAISAAAADNFWSGTEAIVPEAEQNLSMNMYYAFVAGQYTRFRAKEIVGIAGNGNSYPDRGENIGVDVTLRNKGLGDAHNLSCAITVAGNPIQWQESVLVVPAIPKRSNTLLHFLGTVSADAPIGVPLAMVLTMSDPSGFLIKDTTTLVLGTPTPILADDAENGASFWTMNGWDQTGDSHSGRVAYTDSPIGFYDAYANRTLTLTRPMDLSTVDHAYLKFWTRWEIEPRFDFGRVEISTDAGDTWHSLRATFTRPGSGLGAEEEQTFGFDGYTPGMEWVETFADISPFVHNHALLQFHLMSDGQLQRNGWFIDDIRVDGYTANVLSAGNETPTLPREDRLLQNYPNPFNPTTTIVAELAKPGWVTVAVYDMLGRQVTTLIDRDMPAGTHPIRFTAAQLASGLYWYRMTARHIDGTITTFSKSLILAR